MYVCELQAICVLIFVMCVCVCVCVCVHVFQPYVSLVGGRKGIDIEYWRLKEMVNSWRLLEEVFERM